MKRGYKLILLLAITLLAAFLRLYRIDSLPPSDGYDQAAYGLDVLAILKGAHPIFFPSNFGREALFSYLITLCYLVIGDVAIAVYVTSAIAGVLAVPATYLAAEEILHDEEGALGRLGSLLAALALAVLYWHFSWSRLGMRAILVPLLASTTVWLMLRGLRTGSHWAFAGCGLSLGLSLHTYQAARALPLLVLLGLAYAHGRRRSFRRRDLADVLLVFGIAALVFAPLGVYFLAHPGSSDERIGQTLVVESGDGLQGNARTLLEQTINAAAVLLLRGDADARVNVLGHAALNPFFLTAGALGLAFGLARLRQARYLVLLLWLGGLTVPAILARYGAVTKRAIGATPAVAIYVAVGCLASWDAVQRWAARRHPSWQAVLRTVLAVAIGGGILYTGISTYHDYFVVWASDPNMFTHFETGQSAIGRYIKDLPLDERIYISPVPADHQSVVLNSGQRQGYKSYQGRFCMVVPAQTTSPTTYVIVPTDDKNSLSLLESYLPQGEIVHEGPLHYGQPYFYAYQVPAGVQAQLAPAHPANGNWDDKIRLLGYDLDQAAYKRGETIHLTLYDEALSDMERDYTLFVHLLGPTNPASGTPLWAQSDSEPCKRGYPTSTWAPGEVVIDHYSLTILADAPAGTYQIAMGFYNWQTMERLSVLDETGSVSGDLVILQELRVE
jgi:hypothetical protein